MSGVHTTITLYLSFSPYGLRRNHARYSQWAEHCVLCYRRQLGFLSSTIPLHPTMTRVSLWLGFLLLLIVLYIVPLASLLARIYGRNGWRAFLADLCVRITAWALQVILWLENVYPAIICSCPLYPPLCKSFIV